MNILARNTLSAASLALLAACAATPLAPTAGVTPGPGKSAADFAADVEGCKATAAGSVKGQVDAANQKAALGAAGGLALGAITGGALGTSTANAGDAATAGAQASAQAQGSIQQQYDANYNNCMFAKGDVVPGMAPPVAVAEAPPQPVSRYDYLTAQVQSGLIRLGYLHGRADGIAGPMTATAISKFEAEKGLPVNGLPSHDLLGVIKTAEANAGPAEATTQKAGWIAPPPPAADATTQKAGWVAPPPPAASSTAPASGSAN
jgi:hypothetical protein